MIFQILSNSKYHFSDQENIYIYGKYKEIRTTWMENGNLKFPCKHKAWNKSDFLYYISLQQPEPEVGFVLAHSGRSSNSSNLSMGTNELARALYSHLKWQRTFNTAYLSSSPLATNLSLHAKRWSNGEKIYLFKR